jgi:Tfp pilus assembly protein PilN
MIKVNLLPPEYRKVDGTPVTRLVALVLGVFLTASAVGVWGWYRVDVLNGHRAEREQLEEALVHLERDAERSQRLLREFKEYQRRRETIESIGSNRVIWSRKLDELADIIHNKGDTKRHLVWLSAVRTAAGRRKESPVLLQITGLSGGDYANLSEFNKDIRQSDFFADFSSIDPPAGRVVAFTDGRVPREGFDFTFSMDMKPANWQEKQ